MFDTEIHRCPDGTQCLWNNLPSRFNAIAPHCKPGKCLRKAEEAATAVFLTEQGINKPTAVKIPTENVTTNK